LNQRYDAVVVGAGPAGSRVARDLAAAGFHVALLEKSREIGLPGHCSGLATARTLEIAEVDDEIVLNTIRGALLHLPSGRQSRWGGGLLWAGEEQVFPCHAGSESALSGHERFAPGFDDRAANDLGGSPKTGTSQGRLMWSTLVVTAIPSPAEDGLERPPESGGRIVGYAVLRDRRGGYADAAPCSWGLSCGGGVRLLSAVCPL